MVGRFKLRKLEPAGASRMRGDSRIMFAIPASWSTVQNNIDRFGSILLGNHFVLVLNKVIEYEVDFHFCRGMHNLRLHVLH